MANRIETRDYDANRSVRSGRSLLDDDVSLMHEIADGIIERDRRRMRREVIRTISFICAILNCVCAGSISSFSLYAAYFQSDLHYTQIQVNAVSIAGELGMYLTIPFLGYICDRYHPPPMAFLGAITFGFGYILAAYAYKSGPPAETGYGNGWPHSVMTLAFGLIGTGTTALYIAGVATCAKNYGKSKHAGLILALPITAMGLSGMWESQVGEHLLQRRGPDGERLKELDVFKYFIFLGILLFVVGIIGTFGMHIVGEEDLIDEAVDELERSGFLEDSEFFRPRTNDQDAARRGYGTVDGAANGDEDDDEDPEVDLSESMLLARELEREKKNWLLNLETRRFLSDPTMWYLAAGFFLLIGPAESYINNFGTIIESLSSSDWNVKSPAGSAGTHVTTIAICSTTARLLTGTLSDLIKPRRVPNDAPKITSTPPSDSSETTRLVDEPEEKVVGISRVYILLTSAILLLLCFLSVAVLVPAHPGFFPVSSAFMGFAYGTGFSCVPILISAVWGVENFGTNWGIVALMPAGGAAVYSAFYAIGYGNATLPDEHQCYGAKCFLGWAWVSVASVVIATILFIGSWRGWKRRGVDV